MVADSCIEPLRLCRQGAVLQSDVEISGWQRLREAVGEQRQGIQGRYRLCFGIDAEGTAYVGGDLILRLLVQCQRCLGPMPWQVERRLHLGVAEGAQAAKRLPACYEPLELREGRLALQVLLEDEALLALPIAPMHPPQQCPARPGQPGTAAPRAGVQHPFAVLRGLRGQRD